MNSFGLVSSVYGVRGINAKYASSDLIDIKEPYKNVGIDELDNKSAYDGTINPNVVISKLDPVLEKEFLQIAKEYNKKLSKSIRDKYNFGYAKVDIDGVEKTNFYAHSKISDKNYSNDIRVKSKIQDISEEPKEKIFDTLELNSDNTHQIIDGVKPWDRVVDSECKIIHDIANRLGNRRDAIGTIKLYTQLECCPSCKGVIQQFSKRYRNIKIEVLYETEFY